MLRKTDGFYDGVMSHGETASFVNENGRDDFLDYLQQQFPGYGLGGYSTSWEDDPKFICKANGKYGDVIIGWEENL